MSFAEAGRTYSILTVGDGLVAQIPALFVSITAGTVVTRVAGGDADSLGGEIAQQLGDDSRALWAAAAIAVMIGFIPGFPTMIFLAIAVGLAALGRAAARRQAAAIEEALPKTGVPPPPSRVQLVLSPALAQEFPRERLQMVMARAALALAGELGLPVPPADITLSELPERGFRIDLDGVPLAEGTLPEQSLLLRDDVENATLADAATVSGPSLPGIDEPLWIAAERRPQLLASGVGFMEPVDVLAHAMGNALRRYAGQLVGVQEARQILAAGEPQWGELVREVQRIVPLQRAADLFRRLLDEGLMLRNLRGILESILEHAPREQDPAMLAELVRAGMRRHICHSYADNLRVIGAYIVDAEAEALLRSAIQQAGNNAHLNLTEGTTAVLVERVRAEVSASRGPGPVVLTAVDLRRHLRALLVNNGVYTPVLSFHDLLADFTVQPLGTIRLTSNATTAPAIAEPRNEVKQPAVERAA